MQRNRKQTRISDFFFFIECEFGNDTALFSSFQIRSPIHRDIGSRRPVSPPFAENLPEFCASHVLSSVAVPQHLFQKYTDMGECKKHTVCCPNRRLRSEQFLGHTAKPCESVPVVQTGSRKFFLLASGLSNIQVLCKIRNPPLMTIFLAGFRVPRNKKPSIVILRVHVKASQDL